MRRRAWITLALVAVLALPAAASAAPSPDAAPTAGGPAPDAAPRPSTPAPTYTPPSTPSYEPSTPTYTPPVRPAGPTPAAPGTAGADLVQAAGARVAAPAPKQQPEQAAPVVEPEPTPAVEPATEPATPIATTPGTEAVTPPATESAPPATAVTPEPAPAASTPAPPAPVQQPQVAAAAPPPAELPVDDRGDSGGLPIDGLGLLVVLLGCGLVLAGRALRHGQRRLAVPLLAFCVVYLAVVGGVFAGVAKAATPADLNLEAAAGDGEVLLTWTPPDVGEVVIAASTTPVVSCTDPAARPIVSPDGATAVDSGLANDVTVYYAACIRTDTLTDSITISATPTAGVDGTAPDAIAGLRVTTENSRVRVRWSAPAAEDVAEVVIVRRLGAQPPRGPKDGAVVYRGLGTTTTDFPVSPRKRVWYAAFAIDDDGNVSTPATGSLPRFDPPLYGPRDGAVIRRSALFRWRPVATASYYNIQIWRGAASRKVISTWVNKPSFVLRQRLAPGRYTWYVFPGFGARSLARYGALVGSATFVIR